MSTRLSSDLSAQFVVYLRTCATSRRAHFALSDIHPTMPCRDLVVLMLLDLLVQGQESGSDELAIKPAIHYNLSSNVVPKMYMKWCASLGAVVCRHCHWLKIFAIPGQYCHRQAARFILIQPAYPSVMAARFSRGCDGAGQGLRHLESAEGSPDNREHHDCGTPSTVYARTSHFTAVR